ncbi:amidase [Sneathiella aquimaris]|uniref:amidase n=1 Tax=Sneathiella aquimaris TaxID=2599305 RepID=UPI00146F626A|nr:amidase [Sneathiella aquimaris]
MSVLNMTATELSKAYSEQSTSPLEVTNQVLSHAAKLEPDLNAFRVIDTETAITQAKRSEARWQKGVPSGPLDGIPISIKDIVAVKGHACLSGSKTNDPDLVLEQDCPSVARLRESGAILFGLTHTPEFGWKGITDSPQNGYTRNPWNTKHSPGGSSGGAAAAVASGSGPLALGTDGGGSVRIPSSYCGLYGIKPTFGRVPHTPNESPYATLVSNGPLSRSVQDAALMLNVMAQPDARDWYAAADQKLDFTKGINGGIEGMKIAYSPTLGGANPSSEVREIIDNAVDKFRDLGANVTLVDDIFPPLRPLFEDYWKAGFGYILKQIPRRKWADLDPGFLALAEQGLSVSLGSYYAAHSERVRLGGKMGQFFTQYDLLLTPTMPSTSPLAETVYHTEDYDRWDDATPYTVPFNLTGHPAASIPAGRSASGLPIGLQIVGARYDEPTILKASRAFEAAMPFDTALKDLIERMEDR